MAEEWYYTNHGRQMGPVSHDQLSQMAQVNRLLPTDLVWKEGYEGWVAAGSVDGLFGAVPLATAPPLELPEPSAAPQFDDVPVLHRVHYSERQRRGESRYYEDEDDYAAEQRRQRRRRRRRESTGLPTGLVIGLIVGGCVLGLFFLIVGTIIVAAVLGGGMGGPTGTYSVSLNPGQSQVETVHLEAGDSVTIDVRSEHASDVDLIIQGPTGMQAGADIRPNRHCHVNFVANQSGAYQFIVVNVGFNWNRSTVTYQIR